MVWWEIAGRKLQVKRLIKTPNPFNTGASKIHKPSMFIGYISGHIQPVALSLQGLNKLLCTFQLVRRPNQVCIATLDRREVFSHVITSNMWHLDTMSAYIVPVIFKHWYIDTLHFLKHGICVSVAPTIFETCISQVPAPQRERAVCEAAVEKKANKRNEETRKRGCRKVWNSYF